MRVQFKGRSQINLRGQPIRFYKSYIENELVLSRINPLAASHQMEAVKVYSGKAV